MVEEEDDEGTGNEGFEEGELEEDSNEANAEVSFEQFDPNEAETDEEQEEFDPNDSNEEFELEQFDPNEDGEVNEENEFDPNETDDDIESHFDPNDYGEEIESELNHPDTEKSEEQESEVDYNENINSESISTVLVGENAKEESECLQSDDHDHEEVEEINQNELDKEVEKELEEGVEVINKYLEEEAEFINAYQEMVGKARELDEERAREGEEPLKTEEEWEKETETAAYNAEQLYENTKEIEADVNNEDLSENSEELSKQVEEELEFGEEERDEIEQHQVEPLIEEELETEPEPIVNDKEIEELQELELEEQFQMVHDKEYIEELVEWQSEKTEQEKEEEIAVQIDNSKEILSELEEDLDEVRDEIEQHQVEAAIEEELETELELIVNDKEIEEIQELDLEEQYQTIQFNDYIEELVEKQEEEKIHDRDKKEQEKENIEQNQEILHQSTHMQEKLEEEREQELELEYEEKDEVEQHQVEAAIEEELETEPKPIIREEEVEFVKNFEPEEQLDAELLYELIEELAKKQNEEEEEKEPEEKEKHEEVSAEEKAVQIVRELEIVQEINSGVTEVESDAQETKLEEDTNSQAEEAIEEFEIEETKDHQQELEEILEQIAKIEQEVLNEIEQEKEDADKTTEENYESAKKLYKQQTGKRPIYANAETKGFKQWLEQNKKSEEKQNSEQKKESKKEEEQKKEEAWKWTLKNWIELATEIEPELKSELLKLVEKYNQFEKLIEKFTQLYHKAKRKELSRAEKNELKSLIEELHKLTPIKIELLLSIREIKRYLDEQYFYNFWDKPCVNQKFGYFFTYLSQKYSSLKQLQKKKNNTEKVLKNWIEKVSEEEISSELKAELKELIENYNELDAVAIMFMKLYTKAQSEILSKIEQKELHSLVRTLQNIDPSKIELFTKIRVIKHYLNDQHLDNSSDEKNVNRILNRFFASLTQIYKEYYQLGKNLKDDRNVDKKALAKELISNMKRQRIVNLRKLGYDDSIPMEEFILHKKNIDRLLQNGIIKDIYDLVCGKGKVQYGFVGFTYRAIDLKTKFFQTGLSFVPHPVRLGWYLYDIIFNPRKYQFRRTGNNQISGWIAKAIDLEYGLQSFRDEVAKGNTDSLMEALNTLFKFEITGVFWDQKLVRHAEDEQIAVTLLNSNRKGVKKFISSLGLGYNLDHRTSLDMKKIIEIAGKYGISENMKGLGLNDPKSSGKGGNPEKAEKFIWKCAYYTALGMPYSQIYEKMKKIGLFKKSLGAFKGEYNKWFGSLEKGRNLFLDPIRESLKELHGYSEGDINRLYPLGKKFDKELFIHLAEENYKMVDIAQKMGWDRHHLGRLVNELINIEYDFIEQYKFSSNKERRTFEDLQYYLIAQKILQQAMGNIPRSEIMKNFEGGMTDDIFREASRRVLKAQKFNNVQDMARKALISALLLEINPVKVRDIANDRRCWIPLATISQKLAQFYKNNPMVQSVISRGRSLTSIQKGRVAIIGAQLKSFYMLGYSNSRILSKLGSAYTLQDIIEITRLVWDTNPDDARRLLHTGFIGS